MGVDFLEDAKGKDYKAFSRICREQHWRRCPRCGGAVEHREDDGSAKCLACTLRFRWAEADLYAKAVTLEQLLLEFKWQSLEKQHRHVEKVRRASAPPANYAGVAAAEDAAAEAAARAGKSRRVSAREVAQRYLGNGQLPPCSKSAWLKLQLWRAAATVPVLVALPVLTNRANKEARVAEIEHESLEWLGIAEPSQETPNAVEIDTGIHHGSAMRRRRRRRRGARRHRAPPRGERPREQTRRRAHPHHRARRRGRAAQRRRGAAAAAARPGSFGTEQRRASEAAEAQRAWVMAQEQRSHSPLVSGATIPTGGGVGKPQGSLPNNPRAAAPEAVPEPLLAHNDDAPAPPPPTPLARELCRVGGRRPAEHDLSQVSNADRSSRRRRRARTVQRERERTQISEISPVARAHGSAAARRRRAAEPSKRLAPRRRRAEAAQRQWTATTSGSRDQRRFWPLAIAAIHPAYRLTGFLLLIILAYAAAPRIAGVPGERVQRAAAGRAAARRIACRAAVQLALSLLAALGALTFAAVTLSRAGLEELKDRDLSDEHLAAATRARRTRSCRRRRGCASWRSAASRARTGGWTWGCRR